MSARDRHPAARPYRFDVGRMVAAVAAELRAMGAAWPEVAALALCVRGVAGTDQRRFAAQLGVAPAQLAAVEEGRVAGAHVPLALRRRAPLVDWSRLDE